ncbi:MAG: hypothetical protein AYK18_03910 [Theionarchaea archaeon DG-70]|nr:MAG: hypothetical protein AYK18_03910 [Theionarchaea archaeon DG-70]
MEHQLSHWFQRGLTKRRAQDALKDLEGTDESPITNHQCKVRNLKFCKPPITILKWNPSVRT